MYILCGLQRECISCNLPELRWTEGTCANTERRVQRLRAAVPPPGEARPDWWIICQLAKRLGFKGFDFESAQEVFDELCSLSPIYAGLDWDRIDKGEYQWPVPEKDHPGTPRLHEEEFKNGRGLFKIIGYRDPAEVIDDEFPIWLTTGRRPNTSTSISTPPDTPPDCRSRRATRPPSTSTTN